MLDTAVVNATQGKSLAYAVKHQLTKLDVNEELEGYDLLSNRLPENEEVLWGAVPFEETGYGELREEEEEEAGEDGEFDSMKMYLRAIGRIPLLSKDEEVALALRIERGREKLAALVFSIPFALKRLVALGRMVENGEVPIEDVVYNNGNGEAPSLEDMHRFYSETEAIRAQYNHRRAHSNGNGKRPGGFAIQGSDGKDLVVPCHEIYGTNHRKVVQRIIALRVKDDFVQGLCSEIVQGVQSVRALRKPCNGNGKVARPTVAVRKVMAEQEARFGISFQELERFVTAFDSAHAEIVAAKNAMSEGNLRLVVSVAKRFIGKGLTFPDLVQEGNIGLMKAIDKFDCHKGFRFSTYAIWWIRQAIKRALDDKSRMIRVPVTILEMTKQVSRARRELTHERHEDPTLCDIAERLKIPMAKLVTTMKLTREPLSLEMPVGDDDGHLSDFIQDDGEQNPMRGIISRDLKRQIERLLVTLSPKEERIVRLRFGIGSDRAYSLEEIADEFSVTRERIRQIETKAIQKLRTPAHSCELREFIAH